MSDVSVTRDVLLDIRGLEVHFETRRGIARAVNDVDLQLYKGERFGLVGESGSGKTTMILALLRMIKTPGFIAGGRAVFDDGTDLLALSADEVRENRLRRVAMVPQGAMNSLNPVMRIGEQIMLTMREHGEEVDTLEAHVAQLLDQVGLRAEVARLYPHELSGGMKQRACIAQAISLGPGLILADEPTAGLDRSTAGEIVGLLLTRTGDDRLTFVGSNKDAAWLQEEVDEGRAAYAVTLPAVTMDEFIEVCRQNRHMPPKSTWFEPKVRSGLVMALLGPVHS